MINLIPPNGQTALKHEYMLRVLAVYGFLLTGVFAACTVLLVPTYLLTGVQLTGAQDQSNDIEETKAAFDAAFSEIKIANTIMGQLRANNMQTTMESVVRDVASLAPSGITFTSFSAERVDGVVREVVVLGRANTRRTLASFKATLETSDHFREAHVPISDLARDTNLPFAVTIVLRDPKEVL